MPITDGFDPVQPLPLAFADQIGPQQIGREIGEEIEPQEFGREIDNARDGAVASSRVLKAGVLIAAATAATVAILAVGNPAALYADVTAAWFGNPAPQADSQPPTPTIQSVPDAPVLIQSAAAPEAVPPTEKDAPARAEVAATEPSAEGAMDKTAPNSDVLFRQFQAWAADNDAQANVRALAQDAPAPIMKEDAGNAPAPRRLVQKQRRAMPVRNARAEARTENVRKKVRRAPGPRAEAQPAEDARTQAQSLQNAEPPSFLTSFGLRN